MTRNHQIAAYVLLKEGDRLMRGRHNSGSGNCALDLPAGVRIARHAFRIADRKRFAA